MEVSTLKPAIYAFIQNMGGNVCFAELMQEFKHELGERNLSLGFDNLIVWAGMSKNVCAALLELNSENVMSFEKVESSTYMFAGSYGLDSPIAESYKNHEQPYWVPSVMNVR